MAERYVRQRAYIRFIQSCYGNTAQSSLANVAAGNGSLDNLHSLGSGSVGR